MGAGAATQFYFDTVIRVTSAAQVEQAESLTNLLAVPGKKITLQYLIQLFLYLSDSQALYSKSYY